ncbi:MAG: carbamoyltransferase HypF [Clostridiaceae bacterium]|nr:carbamoyltransferase HypF [Clostridiaceae bacterium]
MAQVPPVNQQLQLKISGVVQGVGFRPFVARLARRYHLNGLVRNDNGQVFIEAAGLETDLASFRESLVKEAPAGASISRIERLPRPDRIGRMPGNRSGFTIAESAAAGQGPVLPPPDVAVCDDCLYELDQPGNPRYRNPFISCTSCGPRFSIMADLPYDRENTTMADFPMCSLCAAQYGEIADRRFHAQTVCCNDCGPVLSYFDRGPNRAAGQAAVDAVIAVLQDGRIAAIKGIGGYHLACSPFLDETVLRLRAMKGRENKPFAVMFPSLETIKQYSQVSQAEAVLLQSPERPIVLVERAGGAFSGAVCGSSRFIGAFLPYTPIQHLILRQTGPLIMTSANQSDLPMIHEEDSMLAFFRQQKDLSGVLTHNRRILRRLDDSVIAVAAGGPQFIRRARGYVPLPLTMPAGAPPGPAILACGAQQKSTFCLAGGDLLYPSGEIGDLGSRETAAVYRDTIQDMEHILGVTPEKIVCDLHPRYESTRYAMAAGLPVLKVQHHFAHIASVMAETGLTEPVIGVAFDGTGYGGDGTVWGGEFLIASPDGFKRVGHLKPYRLLGADDAVRQGWKTAACLLHDAGILSHSDMDPAPEQLIYAALDAQVNTIVSSSMGRIFDAVSSMLNICRTAGYEGQCAVELEHAAAQYAAAAAMPMDQADPLAFGLHMESGMILADLIPCLRQISADREAGQDPGLLALRFHKTVCRMILDVCRMIRTTSHLNHVALSGGVFQNRILLDHVVPALENAGFTVYTNRRVSPGDGGIALGQAYIGRFAGAEKQGGFNDVHSSTGTAD